MTSVEIIFVFISWNIEFCSKAPPKRRKKATRPSKNGKWPRLFTLFCFPWHLRRVRLCCYFSPQWKCAASSFFRPPKRIPKTKTERTRKTRFCARKQRNQDSNRIIAFISARLRPELSESSSHSHDPTLEWVIANTLPSLFALSRTQNKSRSTFPPRLPTEIIFFKKVVSVSKLD